MAVFSSVMFLILVSMECCLEQRAAIKVCVRTGESLRNTVNKVRTAWTDHALSSTQIQFWFRRFQSDPDRNTKDLKHTGRKKSQCTPAKERSVLDKLDEGKRITVCELAEYPEMSKTTMHTMLRKDLKLRKLAPKFVPKVLTQDQKDVRMDLCRKNIEKLEADPGILSRLIATDESWVFTYDPRTKCADMQWTHPDEPRPRKALCSRSQCKILLILYFDSHGPILCYFCEETVDSDIYINSLKQMQEALWKKHPQMWSEKQFLLLQDNASPHTSIDTAAYLFTVNMAENLWPHPQCSPDLSPCDYWAFPLLKSKLRGHRFQSLEDVKTTVQRTMRDIPLTEYQNCFDKLLVRYRKCLVAGGEYFEGQGSRGIGEVQ